MSQNMAFFIQCKCRKDLEAHKRSLVARASFLLSNILGSLPWEEYIGMSLEGLICNFFTRCSVKLL